MYIPPHFNADDRNEIIEFIRKNSFGILISNQEGKMTGSHLPLILTETGDGLLIEGHVSKGNQQWHDLEKGHEILIIFHGDHGYVSPLLYESKESVPTWNYMAVHVYGNAVLIHDNAGKTESLENMIKKYEPEYFPQWKSLSDEYKNKMLGGIVAFKVLVTRLEGKFKLSQNKSQHDRDAVAHDFKQKENEMLKRLGTEMEKRNK
jgi:transcriptional regulator